MATTPRGIRRDAFIKSVRPDPKSTEELVMLQGYIGDSDLEGHVRVYSDPTLSDSIDLPERDILYADPVNTEEDPLGGSRLWVKKTTVFTAGDPSHYNRVKSSFLEGDLVKAFGNQGGRIPTAVVKGIDNNSFFVACPPLTLPFEVCNAPTGIRDPNCQIFDPTGQFTFQNPSCTPTCPQDPCRPSRRITCVTGGVLFCQFCCGGTHVFQVRARGFDPNTPTMACNPAVQQQATQAYTGGFNPYQTANYGY